jgi:hypothetical protein
MIILNLRLNNTFKKEIQQILNMDMSFLNWQNNRKTLSKKNFTNLSLIMNF